MYLRRIPLPLLLLLTSACIQTAGSQYHYTYTSKGGMQRVPLRQQHADTHRSPPPTAADKR